MQIAVVHPTMKARGGAEKVVSWLCEELARRGHAVHLFTSEYDDDFFGDRKEKKYLITELRIGEYHFTPWKWIVIGWRLRKTLGHFDLITPHNYPAYIWVYLAKIFNRKCSRIVWYCEEPPRIFYRGLYGEYGHYLYPPKNGRMASPSVLSLAFQICKMADQKIAPRMDRILANSSFIASNIEKIYGVRVPVCHPGIPVQRRELLPPPPPGEGEYFMTVSRLYPEKNIDTILRAVRVVVDRKRCPPFTYYIIGEGPEEQNLKTLCTRLQLDQYVRFTGFLSDQEVQRYYASARFVIYLPLDETFGLVFLEAASHKKPVVGPDQGGPTEILSQGESGILVDPVNPHKVASAIETLFTDREKAREMGHNGYGILRERFTLEKFVDRFERDIG